MWHQYVTEGDMNSEFMKSHRADPSQDLMERKEPIRNKVRQMIVEDDTAILILVKDYSAQVQMDARSSVFPSHNTFRATQVNMCLPYSWNDPTLQDHTFNMNSWSTSEKLRNETVLTVENYNSLEKDQQELAHPALLAGRQSWKVLTLTDCMDLVFDEYLKQFKNEYLTEKSNQAPTVNPPQDATDDVKMQDNHDDSDDASQAEDLSMVELGKIETTAFENLIQRQKAELLNALQYALSLIHI